MKLKKDFQRDFLLSDFFFFFLVLWHPAMKFSSNFLPKFLNNFTGRTHASVYTSEECEAPTMGLS